MKNYTITLNGTVYDVNVEEGTGSAAPAAASAPKTAPKAAKPAAAKSAGAGSVKVNAPMPGKILSVKASVGQAVKKGDVLLILEAMKMEVVAPEDGTVASIDVAAGDYVEAVAVLANLN